MSKDKKKKTLYEELEISPLSNKEQIKKAYKKKVKKVHPDKGGDPEEFKRVVEAYLILSDNESRYKYDSQGEEEKPSDRKPIDIGKQAENFLIRTIFDLVDRHGENLPNKNMQKLLIGVFSNLENEINSRLKENRMTWKAVSDKYRAVGLKLRTVKSPSILENMLKMKLTHIETQELMKLRQEHKKLITDKIICDKCQKLVLTDCIDNSIDKEEQDPMDAWDKSMAWGAFNPMTKVF